MSDVAASRNNIIQSAEIQETASSPEEVRPNEIQEMGSKGDHSAGIIRGGRAGRFYGIRTGK